MYFKIHISYSYNLLVFVDYIIMNLITAFGQGSFFYLKNND